MSYKEFKQKSSGRLCRKCIKEKYGVELNRTDCKYLSIPYRCSRCREVKNIVKDVALWSRWKFIFIKNK